MKRMFCIVIACLCVFLHPICAVAKDTGICNTGNELFYHSLVGQGAKKGVFITTSYFSKEARQFQPKGDVKVVLIDGKELANYMIECGVGVSLKQSYQIKRIDTDYFEE